MPVFGIAEWLLMGTAAYVLRASGQRSELSRVLDSIRVGMLIEQ